MDTLDRTCRTTSGGYEAAFDRGAEALADSLLYGLSKAASEVLDDPIVKALMAADGVDRANLEDLLRGTAAKLANRDHFGRWHCC